MLTRIRAKIARWAARGHWLGVMVKTALTHALVVELCVLGGAAVGIAVMSAFGLRPLWAYGFALVGFAMGFRFYIDREFLGENADWEKDGWKAKLDAGLDFAVPLLVAVPTLYGLASFFGMLGMI